MTASALVRNQVTLAGAEVARVDGQRGRAGSATTPRHDLWLALLAATPFARLCTAMRRRLFTWQRRGAIAQAR